MGSSTGGTRRPRGNIRRRGGSFQVRVYAGTDPLTGRPHYLTRSTTDEREARKLLTRLQAEVDEQRNARTKATLGVAVDAWLRVHEVEETTRKAYAPPPTRIRLTRSASRAGSASHPSRTRRSRRALLRVAGGAVAVDAADVEPTHCEPTD